MGGEEKRNNGDYGRRAFCSSRASGDLTGRMPPWPGLGEPPRTPQHAQLGRRHGGSPALPFALTAFVSLAPLFVAAFTFLAW